MIEGVNSVLTNASVLRAVTDQVDAAAVSAPDTVSVKPDISQIQNPSVQYFSPRVQLTDYGRPVIEIRDNSTGTVVNQYPSEQRLQQLALLQAAQVQPEPSPAIDSAQSEALQANQIEIQADVVSAEAQAATQALTSGAEASGQVENLSAGVNVTA